MNFSQLTFANAISISFALHIVIVAAFTVRTVFFPSESTLIQSSIRVDMVALPDKELPKKPPAKKIKTKSKTKKPKNKKVKPKKKNKKKRKTVNLNKTKSKQQKALDRLKAMAALEKLKEEAKEKPTPQPIKGNRITDGSSLKGLDRIQFSEYYDKIKNITSENFNLPQWLAESELRAQVEVRINANGLVVGKKVITSSGQKIFDDIALAAIEKSAPYPPPPSRLANILANAGLVFNFPQ